MHRKTYVCSLLVGLLAVAVLTALTLVEAEDSGTPRALRPAAAQSRTQSNPIGATPGSASPVRQHRREHSSSAVRTEEQLRAAWTNPLRKRIDLGADIHLRNCQVGDSIRESPYPLVLDGHGHTIRQTCFEKRLLRQDGTGFLDIRDVTLTRGGSDGPGAALTSRGEILLVDCVINQNLAEEPGGGVFSMRRVTARRCHINGNLANDDGGAIYARRGGVQVYDSVLSNNLVDGSGGAIGSTGDILVVRSKVDGNTTDGDGGALYADEDGDVTVIDSLIDGSDADGPGGAIFTLDGDVAVFNSTVIGNRADDRGGAISGEADVLVVNSTIARNLAVAHAGGGIWARGNLVLVNATVNNNYAEGEGGGTLSAARTTVIGSTVTGNISSVGGDLGTARSLDAFGSIIGPPTFVGVTGDTLPTTRACRVYDALSRGYNFFTDPSCELEHPTDITGNDPQLVQLEAQPIGFVLVPVEGSPVRGRIPSGLCRGVLPDPLPAGQLLAPYVDWDEVLTHDALGRTRDTGAPCDIGAIQSLPSEPRKSPLDRAPTTPSRIEIDQPDEAIRAPAQATTPTLLDLLDLAIRGHAQARMRSGLLAELADRLDRLAHRLRALRRESHRFDVLLGCINQIGVDQAGNVQHRWGYRYDERDGTGIDLRPALHRNRNRDPELVLLNLSTDRGCLSAAPDPNGTGADARRVGPATATSSRLTVRRLLRRLHFLERREARVEDKADKFDEWESCLTWLPVTEAGDLAQDLGYVARTDRDSPTRRHVPGIDIDASEWDDPDYELLSFVGRDRPFTTVECSTEPGEAVDRTVARGDGGSSPAWGSRDDALSDLRDGIHALREDVEDLGEPVEEITQFDECMYTVGAKERPGYLFERRDGTRSRRSALSFDMRGQRLPELNLMAFSGEEPPQIECNEDAGGQNTDE